jgi:hypothetical protein
VKRIICVHASHIKNDEGVSEKEEKREKKGKKVKNHLNKKASCNRLAVDGRRQETTINDTNVHSMQKTFLREKKNSFVTMFPQHFTLLLNFACSYLNES